MPAKEMLPDFTSAAASRILRMPKDSTDFPDPDSPTIPTVSPFATSMQTSSSACTVPDRVRNSSE